MVANKSSKPKLSRSSLLAIYCTCLALILSLSACYQSSPTPIQTARISSGSIMLSRPAPAVMAQQNGSNLLGFIPANIIPASTTSIRAAIASTTNWLLIDQASNQIKLMQGDKETSAISAEGLMKLEPGAYSLMLKQRNPLWYAPDSYFEDREIPNPAAGSKERYRRGALGDFVLYIDQNTPIHSGPIWTGEVGGLKVDDAELSRIYYQLEVGSYIEVR